MRIPRTALAVALVPVLATIVSSSGGAPSALRPGAIGHGVTLMPNGWKIASL